MVFFESHFTEFKTGVAPNTTYLEWHVGGVPQWGVPWDADTWSVACSAPLRVH